MFRNAITDDFEELTNLLAQLSVCDHNKMTKNSFDELLFLRQSQNIKTIVYETNDGIVATGSIFIEPKIIHNISFVGHIEDVVVRHDQRQKGYGQLIINYLTEYAKQQQCYKVILDCQRSNINFYEKCGYLESSVQMRKDLL